MGYLQQIRKFRSLGYMLEEDLPVGQPYLTIRLISPIRLSLYDFPMGMDLFPS